MTSLFLHCTKGEGGRESLWKNRAAPLWRAALHMGRKRRDFHLLSTRLAKKIEPVLPAESQLDRVLDHRDGVGWEDRNIRQISVRSFLWNKEDGSSDLRRMGIIMSMS